MIFMFFALLPPTLLVCPRVNFLARLNSSESQLFSRCLSEPVGMWTLSTYWERSITLENKILESNWAPNYNRGLYSSKVIGRPGRLSTALNRFVPRSQLSFSSFFHENRNHFLTPKKKDSNLWPWARLNFTVPLKITADPVGILRSKNDQKKH